jgi:hypothetical protein
LRFDSYFVFGFSCVIVVGANESKKSSLSKSMSSFLAFKVYF